MAETGAASRKLPRFCSMMPPLMVDEAVRKIRVLVPHHEHAPAATIEGDVRILGRVVGTLCEGPADRATDVAGRRLEGAGAAVLENQREVDGARVQRASRSIALVGHHVLGDVGEPLHTWRQCVVLGSGGEVRDREGRSEEAARGSNATTVEVELSVHPGSDVVVLRPDHEEGPRAICRDVRVHRVERCVARHRTRRTHHQGVSDRSSLA